MKYCKICGIQIYGWSRKYCKECKSKIHKQQMHNHYESNKCKWLCEDGKYKIQAQRCKICGSFTFCEHRNPNFKIEEKLINEEMKRLGLNPIIPFHHHKKDTKNYNQKRSKKYYKLNKNNIKYKSLYYIKLDEGYLLIHLLYNIKTNHIGIRTTRSFYKKKKHLDT